MVRILRAYKKTILLFLLILSIFYALYGLYRDVNNTNQDMMSDFQSRVVATRLLNVGKDPYFYKWSPGDSETYLDPRDFPERPMSRVTVPPTTLLMNNIIIGFSYTVQKRLWLVFQWAALLISFWILSKRIKSNDFKAVFWILGLTLISGSWMWRFHIDAGQLYIFYTMLLIISYDIFKRRGDSVLAGIIIGFTASLRPNDIVFCIPFVVTKKIRTIVGTIIGFASNIALAIGVWGISPWLNYYRAVNLQGKVHMGWLNDVVPNSVVYGIQSVEGITHINSEPRFLFTDSSLQWIFHIGAPVLFISLAVILMAYMCFLLLNKNGVSSPEITAFVGVTSIIITEFFIPAARYAYYDVIWIFPLGLAFIIYTEKTGINRIINLSMMAFLIALLSFGEIIPTIGVFIPALLCLVTVWLSMIIVREQIRNHGIVMQNNS